MQLRNSRYMQRGATKSLHQLGDSKGSLLMLLVAFLWSLTSTFDKMGMAASPTLAVYLGVQRAMVAVPCVLYLLVKDLASFRCVRCLLSKPLFFTAQLCCGLLLHRLSSANARFTSPHTKYKV